MQQSWHTRKKLQLRRICWWPVLLTLPRCSSRDSDGPAQKFNRWIAGFVSMLLDLKSAVKAMLFWSVLVYLGWESHTLRLDYLLFKRKRIQRVYLHWHFLFLWSYALVIIPLSVVSFRYCFPSTPFLTSICICIFSFCLDLHITAEYRAYTILFQQVVVKVKAIDILVPSKTRVLQSPCISLNLWWLVSSLQPCPPLPMPELLFGMTLFLGWPQVSSPFFIYFPSSILII